MRLLFKNISLLFFFLLLFGCERDKITEPVNNTLPPAAPSNLNIYAAYDGQIGIEWNSNYEQNLKGYFIYRSINKPEDFKRTAFTVNNYFIDDSLFYDSTYYYKISAVNLNNSESVLTAPVSSIPRNVYSPLPPYRVEINARNWEHSFGIRLFWDPSVDNDIKGYQIYRGNSAEFEADTTHFLDFTTDISYFDTKQIRILTNYYYKIKAVDKGGLKSKVTEVVNDIVLNSPQLIYPVNNSTINSLTEFRVRTVSQPARYKLVVSSNDVYGTILEKYFSTDKINEEISINVSGVQLDKYRDYIWRVYTYTANDINPNSYSTAFTFRYHPTN